MKKVIISEEYRIYENISELLDEERILINAAIDFLNLSYAPYSKFNVAAALLLENGKIISGANQENSSYPLCLCAERVALHHAAMRFPNTKIKLMAITARNKARKDLGPVPPCGACRQVIAEYEKKLDCKIRILLKGDTDEVVEFRSISQILPMGFNGDYLGNPLA